MVTVRVTGMFWGYQSPYLPVFSGSMLSVMESAVDGGLWSWRPKSHIQVCPYLQPWLWANLTSSLPHKETIREDRFSQEYTPMEPFVFVQYTIITLFSNYLFEHLSLLNWDSTVRDSDLLILSMTRHTAHSVNAYWQTEGMDEHNTRKLHQGTEVISEKICFYICFYM